MKRILATVFMLVVLVGIYVGTRNNQQPPQSAPTASPAKQTPKPVAAFDKSANSTSDPSSIWVVVNKKHPLNPLDYAPAQLVTPNVVLRSPGSEEMKMQSPAALALVTMFNTAKSQGINLKLSSGYRSFATQSNLYNYYVKVDGQAQADKESARPGYSEHQTGWAADIMPSNGACAIQQCFGTTPEGKWLKANSYKYGFIIRYTTADQDITGYEAEPWHIRYIGKALASYMRDHGETTLETFFGISGGSSY